MVRYFDEEVNFFLIRLSMIMNHHNTAKYGRERYKNHPENRKQRLVEYRKKNYKQGKIKGLHQ